MYPPSPPTSAQKPLPNQSSRKKCAHKSDRQGDEMRKRERERKKNWTE